MIELKKPYINIISIAVENCVKSKKLAKNLKDINTFKRRFSIKKKILNLKNFSDFIEDNKSFLKAKDNVQIRIVVGKISSIAAILETETIHTGTGDPSKSTKAAQETKIL